MKLGTEKISGMVLAGVLTAGSLTVCGDSGTTSTIAVDAATAASGNSQAATGTTAVAGEKKTLGVTMEYTYASYNWTQPDDSDGATPVADSNEFTYGYDVMMTKKAYDELGYDLETARLGQDSLVPVMTTGGVDHAIARRSITSERLQAVDFIESYYYVTTVTLVKEGNRYTDAKSVVDLARATCISQQSTIWYNICLPQIERANALAAAASVPDILMSLNMDKCDLVVTDQPTGRGTLITYPNFKMIEFGGGENDFQATDEDINIGISLKKGNTELQGVINSTLIKMTKDDFSQVMDEAISVQLLAN